MRYYCLPLLQMAIVPQLKKSIKMTRIEKQLAVAKLHYNNLVHAAETGQGCLEAEKLQLTRVLKRYGLGNADFTSNSWVEQGVLDDSKYIFKAYVKCETGHLTQKRRENLQKRLQVASSFSVGYVMEDGFVLTKRIR